MVDSKVTFEFVEKFRKSFAEAEANTDNTGYLDVSEFTAFMRRTYPDIIDREAQIIFMKSNENFSDKPYKALQTLRSAQIGVRLPNKIFIHAVDQFLKHLRNETNKVCF
ncbi:unnamed protein product [Rotaria sp. Silwood1]|nr:unnamed protein product [Rotaria sp. Silwood1]